MTIRMMSSTCNPTCHRNNDDDVNSSNNNNNNGDDDSDCFITRFSNRGRLRHRPSLLTQKKNKNLIQLSLVFIIMFVTIITITTMIKCIHGQQQDPMSLNGGSVLAMVGKDCIAVAVDKRFGFGTKLVNICRRPVLFINNNNINDHNNAKFLSSKILLNDDDETSSSSNEKDEATTDSNHDDDNDNKNNNNNSVMVAFTGLQGDIQSFMIELLAQMNNKYNRGLGFGSSISVQHNEASVVSPKTVASVTSHLLYHRKRSPYYVEPIIVGFEKLYNYDDDNYEYSNIPNNNQKKKTKKIISNMYNYRPFVCSMDIIGATSYSNQFVCAGVASKSLYGIAESYWKPNMNATELCKVCGIAFLTALERDCLSGYGAIVYLLQSDGSIIEYHLSGRND